MRAAGFGFRRRVRAGGIAAMAMLALLVGGPAALANQPGTTSDAASAAQQVQVNGTDSGRVFDGIGGESASSSRLLYDYPEPERSQILDYLFKPDYGASLQILKVEIGSDANSTFIAEPSIERSPGQVDCNSGVEWWLMEQAQKRNPAIQFYGLAWGAPGWFQADPGQSDTYFNRFFSQDNINYLMSWLGCARQHGLNVGYLGGWNEAGFSTDESPWFEALHQALVQHHYSTQIVGADMYGATAWDVATAMKNDPALNAAIGVVGMHDPCTDSGGNDYETCSSTADAQSLDKPLWASETSSLTHDIDAGAIARSLNRDYIQAQITGDIFWSPVSSEYGDLRDIADTGLMLASTPWSGYYDVGRTIWTVAQTTQFAQPGWRYLDGASGMLSGGGSYVTLRAPNSGNYSTVIETTDATTPQTLHLTVSGGLSAGTVHEWSTDLGSTNSADYFVHTNDIRPAAGGYTVTLQPNHVYTLTTTTGQHKGTVPPVPAGRPAPSQATQMALPFRQTFDGLRSGQLAPDFMDLNGGFQAAPCTGGRTGMCYEQAVPQAPIPWLTNGVASGAVNSTSTSQLPPGTVVGDPRWWGNYQVSVDVNLPSADATAELLGRVDSERGAGRPSGYFLQISSTGWTLTAYDVVTDPVTGTILPAVTLASGTLTDTPGSWHQLTMRFQNNDIQALIDGQQVADVTDDRHTTGQVGLSTGGWYPVQFDNLTVTPTEPAPQFISHAGMTATASSSDVSDGRNTYDASNAIDDRPETRWNAATNPAAPLPQAITLDLGRQYPVGALTYQPKLGTDSVGMISGYTVSISTNGSDWTQVATGVWPATSATKVASWSRSRLARYVKLTATSVYGCPAAAGAGEINVSTTPLPMTTADTSGTTPPACT